MNTYADNVRDEIFETKPLKGKYKDAFSYGILLMGNEFNSDAVTIATEHSAVSKLYGFAISDIVNVRADFWGHQTKNGKSLYNCRLSDPPARQALLKHFNHPSHGINEEIIEGDAFPQFLAGVFMAAGSVSDPEKTYHLEFVPPSGELCDILFEHLTEIGYPPKSSQRRGSTVIYYKESSQIEDILTIIGAQKSSLLLMEAKIYKDLRNRANRSTNCETANIDKTVKAAISQREDIAFLLEKNILETLTPALKSAAMLRLDNPDS
ncbi:MAG: DNA-binding protein WhiA, partial [Oscillospiraceae bacterium]